MLLGLERPLGMEVARTCDPFRPIEPCAEPLPKCEQLLSAFPGGHPCFVQPLHGVALPQSEPTLEVAPEECDQMVRENESFQCPIHLRFRTVPFNQSEPELLFELGTRVRRKSWYRL